MISIPFFILSSAFLIYHFFMVYLTCHKDTDENGIILNQLKIGFQNLSFRSIDVSLNL